MMHPLVRDLWKRVLIVGKDYPTDYGYVKRRWKKAIMDPRSCPSCYEEHDDDHHHHHQQQQQQQHPRRLTSGFINGTDPQCIYDVHKAVGKGRYMLREMIGIVQLKKYRTMQQRYGIGNHSSCSTTSNDDFSSREILSEIDQTLTESLSERLERIDSTTTHRRHHHPQN